VFGSLGSAFGLIPVFWANGAFLLAGGILAIAERRVGAVARTIVDTPQEEKT
jgi:hypothetical protein